MASRSIGKPAAEWSWPRSRKEQKASDLIDVNQQGYTDP